MEYQSEAQSVTITVHEDYVDAVQNLVGRYAEAVKIGRFRPTTDLGPPTTFPTFDPTIIEAFKQATLILAAGTAGLRFLDELRKLISSSQGKVRAVESKSRKPIG